MQLRNPAAMSFPAFLVRVFVLMVCFFIPVPSVYALPPSATGWVEVRCEPVPSDFSDTATVVLSNTETGEYHTITCHKINGYIGRLELPLGKYQVEQTSTADNFAYEAFTKTTTFEITADMPAAQLITMEIVKHDVSYTVPESELPPTATDSPTDVPATAEPSDLMPDTSKEDTQNPSNPLLDKLLGDHTSSEKTDAAPNEDAEIDEEPASSKSQNALKVIVGTVIFIAIIFVIALFARHHFEQE